MGKASVKEPVLPTHDELIEQYRNGAARLDVDRVNHREFIFNGIRYSCGWSSERDTTYKPKKFSDPEYRVVGWRTYKAEAVSQ